MLNLIRLLYTEIDLALLGEACLRLFFILLLTAASVALDEIIYCNRQRLSISVFNGITQRIMGGLSRNLTNSILQLTTSEKLIECWRWSRTYSVHVIVFIVKNSRLMQWWVHAGPGAQALQIVASPLPKFSWPQIVARPSNLAVLLTHCGQLILRKISKCDATRCQILRLKYTKFDFRWGSAPDPAEGAYIAPQTFCLYLRGPTSKARKGKKG